MKEQSESKARKDLMKIQESEFVAETELDEVRRERYKSDLDIYSLSKKYLQPYEISNLKQKIDESYIHDDLYSKLKSYVSYYNLGEIYFKDNITNSLHKDFVEELRELILLIQDNCIKNIGSNRYEILENKGYKEELIDKTSKAFEKYNKFNLHIKNEML